jgi:hypothetical protein
MSRLFECKDVFLSITCRYFHFQHSRNQNVLSDGYLILRLRRWSAHEKALILRVMGRPRIPKEIILRHISPFFWYHGVHNEKNANRGFKLTQLRKWRAHEVVEMKSRMKRESSGPAPRRWGKSW